MIPIHQWGGGIPRIHFIFRGSPPEGWDGKNGKREKCAAVPPHAPHAHGGITVPRDMEDVSHDPSSPPYLPPQSAPVCKSGSEIFNQPPTFGALIEDNSAGRMGAGLTPC